MKEIILSHTKPFRWEKIYIALFILIALFLRIWQLDKIPNGITDDELDYVFTSKIISYTGHNLAGNWIPWSLRIPPDEAPKAELPYILLIPFSHLPNPLFSARIMFVLANVLFVYLLYAIVRKLFGISMGIVAGFVAAINPWSIFFARTSFEAPLAVTAFYAGVYWLLHFKSKWQYLASIAFGMSFFLYIGMKVVLMPLVIWVVWWSWKQKQIRMPCAMVTIGIVIMAMFYYFIFGSTSIKARGSELFFPWSSSISRTVDWNRRNAIPSMGKSFFDNKVVVYIRQSSEKYLKFFSPEYLLLYGDSRSSFSVWSHGILYVIDSFFVLFGVYWLIRSEKEKFKLLVGILLLSPIPSVMSDVGTTYSTRASVGIPIFIIFIALGIVGMYQIITTRYKKMYTVGVTITYILLCAQFMYIYLYRNPVVNAEGYAFSERVVASYIARVRKHDIQLTVATENGIGLVKKYSFYQNRIQKTTLVPLRQVFLHKTDSFDGIYIARCTPKVFIDQKGPVIVNIGNHDCVKEIKDPHVSVSQLSDGAEIYKIYHDTLCTPYALQSYPRVFSMNDFSVETLSDEIFCQRYISKLPINPTLLQ
jgi:4-amino-4-deoxy-L-arabinose transferase-like glycosyltransferase